MAEIKLLDIDTFKDIFDSRMKKDFPPSELRPLKSCVQLIEDGDYFPLGYYKDDKLMAYALIAKSKNSGFALLDYFAVSENARGQGIGSKFLPRLQEILIPHGVDVLILEVESIEAAEDENEENIRKRRVSFYENCGCSSTNVCSYLFGVDYDVMIMNYTKNTYTDQELVSALDGLYRVIVSTLVSSEEEFQKVTNLSIRDS